MQFTILSTVAFAAVALAQNVAFTSFPMTVSVGKPTELTYTAPDINAPATIVLRMGPSTNLMTVQTITDSATGGRYTWTPSSSLVNGDNYALEIMQGSEFNYGTQFAVTGGATSSSSSSASSSASSTSASSSSLSSISTRVPIPIQTGSPTLNMTYGAGNVTVAPATGTGAMPLYTATGTGAPNLANTTFSSATLSTPTTTGGSSAGATNGPAATSGGSGAAATTSATGSSSAAHFGSSFALIAGAVAAFVFLN